MTNKIKGDLYEQFVLDTLATEYDYVYYFKNTPEYYIAKTNLHLKYDIYHKYKNSDIGSDLVAIKGEQVYFIQCKNYTSNTIGIDDLSSFYFLLRLLVSFRYR
jgi:predicted helicase